MVRFGAGSGFYTHMSHTIENIVETIILSNDRYRYRVSNAVNDTLTPCISCAVMP
jgi:hypothetical protein